MIMIVISIYSLASMTRLSSAQCLYTISGHSSYFMVHNHTPTSPSWSDSPSSQPHAAHGTSSHPPSQTPKPKSPISLQSLQSPQKRNSPDQQPIHPLRSPPKTAHAPPPPTPHSETSYPPPRADLPASPTDSSRAPPRRSHLYALAPSSPACASRSCL